MHTVYLNPAPAGQVVAINDPFIENDYIAYVPLCYCAFLSAMLFWRRPKGCPICAG